MTHAEAAELHFLLFSTMGLFHDKFLHQFRKNAHRELKKNHVKIISMLYQHPSLTSTDIARMLDIEKGSVTTLIDQLTEAGLVVRHDTPCDRRKIQVKLTELGRTEMEQIMATDIQCITELFKNIDVGDHQQFIESLHYVVAFMKEL